MKNRYGMPENLAGKELYKWLIANKSLIIKAKKSATKEADCFAYSPYHVNEKGQITKGLVIQDTATFPALNATLIINTTNWFDSHDDVHIDGLWDKSLKEIKLTYLIQEHKLTFQNIITEDVKASTKKYSFKDLGIEYDGTTQALVFTVVIGDRNPFMYEQYKKGYVKNHSVGMQYVQLFLAINDQEFKDEFAMWNKYYERIANKDEVDDNGYFWAVTEAKMVEGSAVPIGSNPVTPVYNITTDDNSEDSTKNQPAPATEEEPQKSFMDWIQETKFINI